MEMMKYLLWGAVFAAILILYKQLEQKLTPSTNYREAYRSKELLTKRELQEYYKLKQYADERGWLICPKVRLWDLIEPKNSKNQTLVNKIQAKHVDFVLVNRNMDVIGVLELDDSTHDRPDRQQRDSFVRDALEGAGITMIQTRSITPETLNGFLQIRIERKGPTFEEWKKQQHGK